MSSAEPSKVSFTIRRPTPVSRASSGGDSGSEASFKVPALPRHLAGGSGSAPGSPLARSATSSPKPNSRTHTERESSDEDEETEDELVTGFDQFGVQRLHEKKKEPQGPLVIPALKNKDWRELARKRKQLYVPPSAAAQTGADGSVGGLGTRDMINSGPHLVGLQVHKRMKVEEDMTIDSTEVKMEESTTVETAMEVVKKDEETDDEKALRVILANANSDNPNLEGPHIEVIPAAVSEDDAYKQDVAELPDPATLEDYERVPVSQFGAALLRGMGWKEGTAASRKQKGPIEPYLPQARPALLGIGAKEKEVFDDGSLLVKGKKGGKGRPERRYVPVIKKEKERRPGDGEEDRPRERSRERSSTKDISSRRRSPSPERGSSRRHSRSPSPERWRDPERSRRDADYERDKNKVPDTDRERDRRKGDRPDYESSRRDRDRNHDSDKERRGDRSVDRYASEDRRRDRDRRDRY
ncbi:uncharacterized protein LAESUDRAFT_814420 [Laetiporus sulphureus 93-53]|uniref:G-patch domain-containing protein n=1 Tax=Laetiporus sulphureus 93-53 TaxID=1314785 RepID=A0A165CYJ2_9APHY|nr:uncharacterized protein LAESUDRAFT_814420 [Laetiporus sulphureus 93-53]KZT03755.1 hypothetical protein LAESUDRAFT_814420 [Laetiporus sulphureus 93-53]